MANRSIHDGSDPALRDEEWQASAELMDDEASVIERDLATEALYDTQHGDGHTYNPQLAVEQGLTYTPPDDPPVLPSDDPQGAEVAAGFGQSMEEMEPDAEVLPEELNNNDVELQNDLYLALRANSETQNLSDVTVRVHNGRVLLLGTVPLDVDVALVDELVAGMAGVEVVENRLEVAD